MPLYKTSSGTDKQTIHPRTWTPVTFRGEDVIPLAETGWSLYGVMLRIEYPAAGGPSVLRGRLFRFPGTSREDVTGFDDKPTWPGDTCHSYWSHFVKGQRGLVVAFRVWHDGLQPITLDGRQFKWTRLK